MRMSGMARELVSERIGQFFLDEDRLEYTEYGAGDAGWCCCTAS